MRPDAADMLGGSGGHIDHGTGFVTIPAASAAASVTVQHNLGVIPRRILVTSRNTPFGAYIGTHYTVSAVTAQSFVVSGFNQNGYTGGVATNFDWLAIA